MCAPSPKTEVIPESYGISNNNILRWNDVDDSNFYCIPICFYKFSPIQMHSNYTCLMLIITYETEFSCDFELAKITLNSVIAPKISKHSTRIFQSYIFITIFISNTNFRCICMMLMMMIRSFVDFTKVSTDNLQCIKSLYLQVYSFNFDYSN